MRMERTSAVGTSPPLRASARTLGFVQCSTIGARCLALCKDRTTLHWRDRVVVTMAEMIER